MLGQALVGRRCTNERQQHLINETGDPLDGGLQRTRTVASVSSRPTSSRSRTA